MNSVLHVSGYLPIVHDVILEKDSGREYWRIPSDVERMDITRNDFRVRTDGAKGPIRTEVVERDVSLPCVFRVFPFHHVVLDCRAQKLWRAINPMLSDQKWSSLLGNHLAWCNGSGFPGHYNCITGEGKPAVVTQSSYPRFDQARVCADAILAGKQIGYLVHFESLRIDKPYPSPTELVHDMRHLWYYGKSINTAGQLNYIMRLGVDGALHRVRIPLFADAQIYLPFDEVVKL